VKALWRPVIETVVIAVYWRWQRRGVTAGRPDLVLHT
jgi:hypothetical protein